MRLSDWRAADRRYLLLFCAAAVCLAGIALYGAVSFSEEETVFVESGAAAEERAPAVTVYISGGVKHPGVYEVPEGSRVYELVKAAGDVVPYADVEAVNLSKELSDGEWVHIPVDPDRVTAADESVVNINTAGAAELETLPGIGEVTAKKILDYRAEHGPFAEKEDLMKVPSIGEGRYGKIADKITL